MPLIHLPVGWTVVLDSIAWTVIQLTISYLGTRLPTSALDVELWLFRMRKWERSGDTYARLLRVRRWKALLPSGGALFRGGFSMKRMVSHREEYLERWINESCRSEWVHWTALVSCGLFFLWNPPSLGIAMVLYAVIANLPCIVVQRYNRPRIRKILRRRELSPFGATDTSVVDS